MINAKQHSITRTPKKNEGNPKELEVLQKISLNTSSYLEIPENNPSITAELEGSNQNPAPGECTKIFMKVIAVIIGLFTLLLIISHFTKDLVSSSPKSITQTNDNGTTATQTSATSMISNYLKHDMAHYSMTDNFQQQMTTEASQLSSSLDFEDYLSKNHTNSTNSATQKVTQSPQLKSKKAQIKTKSIGKKRDRIAQSTSPKIEYVNLEGVAPSDSPPDTSASSEVKRNTKPADQNIQATSIESEELTGNKKDLLKEFGSFILQLKSPSKRTLHEEIIPIAELITKVSNAPPKSCALSMDEEGNIRSFDTGLVIAQNVGDDPSDLYSISVPFAVSYQDSADLKANAQPLGKLPIQKKSRSERRIPSGLITSIMSGISPNIFRHYEDYLDIIGIEQLPPTIPTTTSTTTSTTSTTTPHREDLKRDGSSATAKLIIVFVDNTSGRVINPENGKLTTLAIQKKGKAIGSKMCDQNDRDSTPVRNGGDLLKLRYILTQGPEEWKITTRIYNELENGFNNCIKNFTPLDYSLQNLEVYPLTLYYRSAKIARNSQRTSNEPGGVVIRCINSRILRPRRGAETTKSIEEEDNFAQTLERNNLRMEAPSTTFVSDEAFELSTNATDKRLSSDFRRI